MVVKGTMVQVGIILWVLKPDVLGHFCKLKQNHMILGDVMIAEVRETKKNFAKLCYE